MSVASSIPSIAAAPRLRPMETPPRLVVPCYGYDLNDAPACKAVGTSVRRGESLIDQPLTGRVVPLAPVDGTIVGHEPALLSSAQTFAGIALETSLPQELIQNDSRIESGSLETGWEALVDRLEKLGVWADRWGSPDLLAQLRGPHRTAIDTILCNALDEDPGVPLQGTIAIEQADDVIAGIKALTTAAGNASSWMVLPYDSPPAAWQAIRAGAGSSLRLAPIRNEYPQSHPSLVVHALTGRKFRPGRLPSDQGVLLLDAAAAAAVGRATRGQPMVLCPLAVHDYFTKQTHWMRVPPGTRVGDVLGKLSVPQQQVELRAGCPLRGVRLESDFVIGGGGELTIAVVPAEKSVNPEPCIRCAWCVEGCPVCIRPAGLLEAAQQEDLYLASQCGLDACIECGICSFVCPSQLPLLGGIRALRKMQDGSRRKRASGESS